MTHSDKKKTIPAVKVVEIIYLHDYTCHNSVATISFTPAWYKIIIAKYLGYLLCLWTSIMRMEVGYWQEIILYSTSMTPYGNNSTDMLGKASLVYARTLRMKYVLSPSQWSATTSFTPSSLHCGALHLTCNYIRFK